MVVLRTKRKSLTILLSSLVIFCLHLLFPKNNSLINYYEIISMTCPPLPSFFCVLFCFSHRKTRWTMSLDNIGLKICLMGTLNSMVTLTFCPWCKLKWSRDEFHNQLQILQSLGTTSWSTV